MSPSMIITIYVCSAGQLDNFGRDTMQPAAILLLQAEPSVCSPSRKKDAAWGISQLVSQSHWIAPANLGLLRT